MKIGIIGAGNVGTGLTKLLAPKGHEILLSFSKDAAKLAEQARALGARSGSVAEAVAFADIVVVATPHVATAEALKQAGAVTRSLPLWDCTNALKPDLSGLQIGTTTSAAEQIAAAAPWARVAKGIPPFAEVMHSGDVRLSGQAPAMFIASDDAEAKQLVTALARELGAAPQDAGPLSNSRYIEPAGYLLVQLAYMLGLGPKLGLSLLRAQS